MKKFDLGISRDSFFRDYFERNFYIRKKALDADLLTLTDIESLLYGADPCDAAVRFYMNGAVPITDYAQPYNDVDGPKFRFIADRIRHLLSDGATMVMNRVDSKVSSIGSVCDQLAEFTGERTVANAYMCSGGYGTFGKHWDTHDIFAIQLQGRKRWRIYGSTYALPLTHQTSRDQKPSCPTVPLFDADLEAGDLLYIPRGWWHEAPPRKSGVDPCHGWSSYDQIHRLSDLGLRDRGTYVGGSKNQHAKRRKHGASNHCHFAKIGHFTRKKRIRAGVLCTASCAVHAKGFSRV